MRTGITIGRTIRGTSAAALASATVVGVLLSAGCSGGTNRFDPLVPAAASRNVTGTWRKASMSAGGRFLTCQDPSAILGDPRTELIDRGVVMDACGPNDTVTFGAMSTSGTGRYTMQTLRGTEAGDFQVKNDILTLLRDTINGAGIGGPKQRTVFSITAQSDGSLVFTPVAQSVGYRKITASLPAFNEDGSLNGSNVAPVTNADGSVNVIQLPNTDSTAIVNSDLTVTVGLSAGAKDNTDTPGFARSYAVEYVFQKL